MLRPDDNAVLCHVGPNSAMGDALRRYWLPFSTSNALPKAEGDPRRIELLGDHFVAFRTSDGQVGLLEEACCHRGASLTLGRVEGCGIRCIYHGWKFATDGTVLETPNVATAQFRSHIRARAYPVREAGGLLWTYLGPTDRQPPFPNWSWFDVSASNRITSVHYVNCNFVQLLEGLVDSSHLNILHSNGMTASGASSLQYAAKLNQMEFDSAPEAQVEDAEFGFWYAALRQPTAADEGTLVRVASFVAPCTVVNANGDVVTIVVPASDERSCFYHVFWDHDRPLGEEPLRTEQLRFVGLDTSSLRHFGIDEAGSPDAPCPANRFHQDRKSLRNGSFSGIPGLIEEDVAVSVSALPIRDRSREMLSRADIGVSRLNRLLLTCARRTREGLDPIGVSTDLSQVRGISCKLPPGSAWQSVLTPPSRDPSSGRSSQG